MSRQHFSREIIAEFRQHLTAEEEVDPATDAVVVLSIRPPHNGENTERIKYGWELAKRVAARRLGKLVEELDWDNLQHHSPTVVLNCESECLEDCLETAIEVGILPTKIYLLDSGSLDVCNTKTNMQALADDPELSELKHLTFVTSGYHAPRTARTAHQHLPHHQRFAVHAVPFCRYPYDVLKKVLGEVKKIRHYAAKGDVAETAHR